jgi:hypothetical protein
LLIAPKFKLSFHEFLFKNFPPNFKFSPTNPNVTSPYNPIQTNLVFPQFGKTKGEFEDYFLVLFLQNEKLFYLDIYFIAVFFVSEKFFLFLKQKKKIQNK